MSQRAKHNRQYIPHNQCSIGSSQQAATTRCPPTNEWYRERTDTQRATWRRNGAPKALDSDEPQNLQKMKTHMGHLTKFHPWELLRAAPCMQRERRSGISELGEERDVTDWCVQFLLGWYNFGNAHQQWLHNPVVYWCYWIIHLKGGEIINFMLHVTCCKILKQDKTKCKQMSITRQFLGLWTRDSAGVV